MKLALVLLTATVLIGGIAFWFLQPRLSREERRLVGRWENELYGQKTHCEFLANRSYDSGATVLPGLKTCWEISDGQLTLTSSYEDSSLLATSALLRLLRDVPILDRYVTLKVKFAQQFSLRWIGEDEVALTLPNRAKEEFNERDPSEITMRRVAAPK
ncbi:hypothetical protein [Planctomicrobium piriforme]|nr:hypothetical protein [Planctomicrobium piriforme]